MKGNKRNGFIKVLAAFVCCGVLCFIFTGAAELNASDLHTGQPLLSGLVNGGASLSALLTVPRFDFDKVISDYNRQESDNTSSQGSITEKEEQTPQTDSNQTSSDIHTSDGQSREESGTNTNSDAPAEDVLVDVSEPLTPETKIISLNLRGDKNDLADFTAKDGEIRRVTYTPLEADNIINLENGQLRNCTELENGDILKIASKPADIDIELNNEPQVLIMHTHTTESYETDNDLFYDTSYSGRSLCPANSVVGIGAVLAQRLADNGICVVHDGTVFDDPVYSNSYTRSRERVEEILDMYPSIKVVLDIHRDGIADGDVRIAPAVEIDGKTAAQVMIICGCDDGSGILPDYRENLRFAASLQTQIEGDNPGLTRPLLFDYRFYNQDLTTGSLLIEFGALGNYISEAEYSAELVGDSLARLLKSM